MASWNTTGNTAAAGDFLGTKNKQPLVVKTNTVERLRVDTNGNVGIGSANPAYALHMAAGKVLRIEGGTNAADTADYFSFGGSGAFGIDAPGVPDGRFVVNNSGNVGIGVPDPGTSNFKLQINGSIMLNGPGEYEGTTGSALIEPGSLSAVLDAGGEAGPVLTLTNTGGGVNTAVAVDFYTFDPGEGVGPDHLTTPSAEIAAIDVGNFANDIVFRGNRPGAANNALDERMRITSTGNINVPGDIILTGADCAEQFDVVQPQKPEPGTVLVIDDGGGLRESRDPYDHRVAGVVSGAGGYRHGILLDKKPDALARVPVALVGKVFCKADARSSPIKVGDLLTTSATPGHAMKATDAQMAFGAVLGKALRPLVAGTGLIPILVALQ